MATHTNTVRNAGKIIKDHQKELGRLALDKQISPTLKSKLNVAVRRLDKEFLEGQAAVIKDLLFDIVENRSDRADALKQRSVWASLDGIAKHLDDSGFTPVFRQVARKMFTKQLLDHPAIVALETELIHDFSGLSKQRLSDLGLGATDLATAMSVAEQHKLGDHGIGYLGSPSFSFRDAMSRACGRPDKLHEVHMAIGKWVPIVTFIANIVVLLFPFGVIISIATIVAGVILALVAGC